METNLTKDGSAKGGRMAAANLTPEQKKERARQGAAARWDAEKGVPRAEYSGTLKIGDMEFPCSVLSDGTRVLTQNDFMAGMGMYYSGWVAQNRAKDGPAADMPQFLAYKTLEPFIHKHLGELQSVTLKYRTENGNLAHGVRADIIPKICDIWLDADEHAKLGTRQKEIAAKAKLIMRALAHVGIIALVDEATGYQRDRAADALAEILEDFIAKELQPWVKTFPDEFYEELFRLRGLVFPGDGVKRPQYFGHLTNDIIYARLAPAVLDELRSTTPKDGNGRRRHHFHRRLTEDIGHPKLREHMAAVLTTMQLSEDYDDFITKLDRVRPRYDETIKMNLIGGSSKGL